MFPFKPLLFLAFTLTTMAWSSVQITPTTTLLAETTNNTSAADNYSQDANGNVRPGNVSHIAARELLYPGATTRIYAHFMAWFGGTNHMDVGYASDDPVQVRKQVQDAVSRGISGFIVDWYGPGDNRENRTTLLLMTEAERNPGFEFAVMVDKGALGRCQGACDVTDKLIQQLNYVFRTYETSPAYMHLNGRPLVFEFGLDRYEINWDRVARDALGNPLFIFQNAGGFRHAQAGYAWVEPTSPDPVAYQQDPNAAKQQAKALSPSLSDEYLSYFYKVAQGHSALASIGAAFKGFDDSSAAWGESRILDQQCGRTWLGTWAKVNQMYSTSRQLDAIQIVTWNDYEEGTEMETGIDNCLSVKAWISGSRLAFAPRGAGLEVDTVDHYTILVSRDGENLMPLADLPSGSRSLELSSFALHPATYQFYVKMQSKPGFLNRMSNPVKYRVKY
jgi:hypothetical protein